MSARLNRLIKLNIIKRNGSKYDPKQTYEMKQLEDANCEVDARCCEVK